MSTNDWRSPGIDGVWTRRNVEHVDERGSFTELWRASVAGQLTDERMVQANLSRSRAGVLRGMHFHLRQVDLWLLVEGEAVAALTDVRGALHGEPVVSVTRDISPGDVLFIPRGVAHGFLALTDITLVYLVSNEYDGSDELGFAWDDPVAAIAWPHAPAVISDRDRANPTLATVIESLRSSSGV